MSAQVDIPQIQFMKGLSFMGEKRSILNPFPWSKDQKGKSNVKKDRRKVSPRTKKIILSSLVGLSFIVLLFVIFGVLPAYAVYQKGMVLASRTESLQVSIQSQDIGKVKAELEMLKTSMMEFQTSYNRLSWTGSVPFVGPYWKDGHAGVKAGLLGLEAAQELVVTVEPYADIIGFTGGATPAKSGEDTANDRIEFLIQSIGQITPKLDGISEKALKARAELATIDPNRYPEEFRGIKLREKLTKGLALADEATTIITEGKPLLEVAPYLLGIDTPRTYLVLFQNDKELRPTGGFLTAYSIMKVTKGKMQPVSSSDIYSLDARYRPTVAAPDELVRYLKGPYSLSKTLFLRDMNWSPDFKTSMDLFTAEAKKAGIPQVDGIIAVDTHVVVKVLDVLGEIGVPGFGNFSTKTDPRCDCPQVIYELESFADVEGPVVWSENEPGKIVFAPKNYGKNRKEIVGPLMNSVLSNALGQPKEKLPDLFQAGWESLMEKHVMLYMFDPSVQAAAESFGIAGRIKDPVGTDYLHVSNANLGGRKSNLYVTADVHQDIKVARDGSVEKTVEITYKNPKPHDGWLNSVLPNWTRIYVPKGSELISMEGFEDKGQTYEELDKTVFSGGFQLRPQGVVKVKVTYKLPFKASGEYKLFVQKQPGTDKPLNTITIGKQTEEVFLTTDKLFRFKI